VSERRIFREIRPGRKKSAISGGERGRENGKYEKGQGDSLLKTVDGARRRKGVKKKIGGTERERFRGYRRGKKGMGGKKKIFLAE